MQLKRALMHTSYESQKAGHYNRLFLRLEMKERETRDKKFKETQW
jgi:hypothetical protein